MIDSFRAHSSFPLRSRSPTLLYGLITETHSISHPPPPPSLTLFLHISSLSTPHPPLRLFIHPSPGKEAVNLRLPPLHPLTCRTSLHLSLHPSIYRSHPSLSLSFTLFSPFPSLSQSFLPLWEFLQDKFTLFLCSEASSSYLCPPFFPPLHSVICHSLYVRQAHSQLKLKIKDTNLSIFALSVCLSDSRPQLE